jgi:glutamine amidotransferase
MRVCVFDYGAGNLHSLVKALEGAGAEVAVETDPRREPLGICLGMQLLLDASEEGPGEGLGVVPGMVTRLRAARVPQIGWNPLDGAADPLLAASALDIAYYANSYVCRPADPAVVTAWSTHEGDRFPAAVRAGHAVGVQFHPEKSSRAGLGFVRAWVEEVRRGAASVERVAESRDARRPTPDAGRSPEAP